MSAFVRIGTKAVLVLPVITTLVMTSAAQQGGDVESIYVARSVRESRIAATEFCAESRIGFANANIEDRYTFRSVAVRTSDGLVTDSSRGQVATAHACFGPTADSSVLNFYGEVVLGGVEFKGKGDCRLGRADYPEPGITPARCFLDLDGLPAGYVGGQLTSNTVVSRADTGVKSHPPGYTQPSIAVIRLWRRR